MHFPAISTYYSIYYTFCKIIFCIYILVGYGYMAYYFFSLSHLVLFFSVALSVLFFQFSLQRWDTCYKERKERRYWEIHANFNLSAKRATQCSWVERVIYQSAYCHEYTFGSILCVRFSCDFRKTELIDIGIYTKRRREDNTIVEVTNIIQINTVVR